MLGAVRARLGWSTILTLAVGIAAAWLAFDNGTYDLVSRNTAAVAVWWAVLTCVAFGLTPVGRVRGVIAIVGLLMGRPAFDAPAQAAAGPVARHSAARDRAAPDRGDRSADQDWQFPARAIARDLRILGLTLPAVLNRRGAF